MFDTCSTLILAYWWSSAKCRSNRSLLQPCTGQGRCLLMTWCEVRIWRCQPDNPYAQPATCGRLPSALTPSPDLSTWSRCVMQRQDAPRPHPGFHQNQSHQRSSITDHLRHKISNSTAPNARPWACIHGQNERIHSSRTPSVASWHTPHLCGTATPCHQNQDQQVTHQPWQLYSITPYTPVSSKASPLSRPSYGQ